MMNLNVALELRSPSFSHCFCAAPRMVRDGRSICAWHEASGKSASPAPPPGQVESASVSTNPELAALGAAQHVYFAERYWRSSMRKNSAPLPHRVLR